MVERHSQMPGDRVRQEYAFLWRRLRVFRQASLWAALAIELTRTISSARIAVDVSSGPVVLFLVLSLVTLCSILVSLRIAFERIITPFRLRVLWSSVSAGWALGYGAGMPLFALLCHEHSSDTDVIANEFSCLVQRAGFFSAFRVRALGRRAVPAPSPTMRSTSSKRSWHSSSGRRSSRSYRPESHLLSQRRPTWPPWLLTLPTALTSASRTCATWPSRLPLSRASGSFQYTSSGSTGVASRHSSWCVASRG